MSSKFDIIYSNSFFDSVIERLIEKQVLANVGRDAASIQLSYPDIRKAVWMASILSMSEDEKHKQKAQDFATLCFMQHKDVPEIQKACYVIYSRSGNLIAGRFLIAVGEEAQGKFLFKTSFGDLLDAELAVERLTKSIYEEREIVTTDFQKRLWDQLNTGKNISVSGPTSSGKSFILQRYIRSRFVNAQQCRILYLVSSRALLSQVSEDFRSILPLDVKINTSFSGERDTFISEIKKHLLVLTPERCLKLIQYAFTHGIVVDTVFVDEIQNVEETEGRGVLLEHVLYEIKKLWPAAQKIMAGPLIKNAADVYADIFNENCDIVSTVKSPVFQIKSILKTGTNGRQHVELISENHTYYKTEDFEKTISFSNLGTGLAHVVLRLGETGQSIIYSPKTNLVQTWAKELALKLPEVQVPARVRELIDFLSEEVHKKYFLIECLKKGVGFHHGKLPDIVRKEIEYLFSEGLLKYLYCTSTLLEGVNLPANNLFIITPQKRSTNLTDFEFGNLIGRAGRIKDSLYGNIFCIERLGENWAERYLKNNHQKDVTSASRNSLSKPASLLPDIEKTATDIKDALSKNTITLLRQKALESEEELNAFLLRKISDPEQRGKIAERIRQSVSGITLPSSVLKSNPLVDPLLQQKLFDEIKVGSVDEWMFHFNGNIYQYLNAAENSKCIFRSIFPTHSDERPRLNRHCFEVSVRIIPDECPHLQPFELRKG